MVHPLISIAALASISYGFFFTDTLVTTCSNAEVRQPNGYTLNEIIDFIIHDTDKNNNFVIDIDEARVELLAQWSGDDKGTEVNRTQFINQFSVKYREDPAISGQFFDSLDETKDGLLTEEDFILQILELDIDLNFTVTLAELRSFIYKHHPNGCKTNS